MCDAEERVVVFAGTTAESDLVRLHLQESGIDARMVGENLGTWAPYAAESGGAGAVKVSVPIGDAPKANDLLQQGRDE